MFWSSLKPKHVGGNFKYFNVRIWYFKNGTIKERLKQRERYNNEDFKFNPLNPELNSICYLLALLGAQHFLHVSRIRVKLLTFRLVMSYIYIWSTHS